MIRADGNTASAPLVGENRSSLLKLVLLCCKWVNIVGVRARLENQGKSCGRCEQSAGR
jgi:hypothetical protein